MFNKSKKKETFFAITCGEKSIDIYGVTDLPFKESVIIQKSVEFYNDPCPCYIHRGAVCNRLYCEINAAIENLPVDLLTGCDIPGIILEYLDLDASKKIFIEIRRDV